MNSEQRKIIRGILNDMDAFCTGWEEKPGWAIKLAHRYPRFSVNIVFTRAHEIIALLFAVNEGLYHLNKSRGDHQAIIEDAELIGLSFKKITPCVECGKMTDGLVLCENCLSAVGHEQFSKKGD